MNNNQEVQDEIQKFKAKILFRSFLILGASLIIPLIPSRKGRIKMIDKIDYPSAVLILIILFVLVVTIGQLIRIKKIKDKLKSD